MSTRNICCRKEIGNYRYFLVGKKKKKTLSRAMIDNIGLDKLEYQVNSFLISGRKHVVGTL